MIACSEYPLNHKNRLSVLKKLGFNITFKLINVGLYGDGEIPVVIELKDVVEYLDSQLIDVDKNTEDYVLLVCSRDFDDFEKNFKILLEKDTSNLLVQKRKWRAVLLKELLENISSDCVQGLVEMLEFWTLMGDPVDSPHIYPNEKTRKHYFSNEMYAQLLKKTRFG